MYRKLIALCDVAFLDTMKLLPSETRVTLPGQVESRLSVSFVHHLDPEMIGQPKN